jgi:hypothetical protein
MIPPTITENPANMENKLERIDALPLDIDVVCVIYNGKNCCTSFKHVRNNTYWF